MCACEQIWCIYVCVSIYIYIYDTCMHAYTIHRYVHNTNSCMHTYINTDSTHMHTHAHTHIPSPSNLRGAIHACIHIHYMLHTCTHMHSHIYLPPGTLVKPVGPHVTPAKKIILERSTYFMSQHICTYVYVYVCI